MPHNAIEQTLSVSRFSTYRNAIIAAQGADCPITALQLYEWNAQLASRFFFPLHIYEVALRNAISEALSKRYGQDWPTNAVFVNSLNSQDKHTLNQALHEIEIKVEQFNRGEYRIEDWGAVNRDWIKNNFTHVCYHIHVKWNE